MDIQKRPVKAALQQYGWVLPFRFITIDVERWRLS